MGTGVVWRREGWCGFGQAGRGRWEGLALFGFFKILICIYKSVRGKSDSLRAKKNTYNSTMADSASHLTPDPPQLQATPSKSTPSSEEHRNFILTEAQRIYIQSHLPKKFTLVQVSEGGSRISCSSRALLQDSLVFIERKRGRPEGSTRKHVPCKIARERKSERIASSCRPNYLLSASKSNMGSLSSSEENEEKEKEDKEKEEKEKEEKE